eukprot:scaffold230554_cov35-Tisochrysis_lutea.AAC.4
MATIALARGAVNCTFRQQADSLTTRSASRHDWAVDVMAITHGCDSRAPYGRACGQAWYDSNAMACCSILGSRSFLRYYYSERCAGCTKCATPPATRSPQADLDL